MYLAEKLSLHPVDVETSHKLSLPSGLAPFQETVRREILEDDGVQQRVSLEQSAIWRFLVFSGTFSVNLDILQNEKERFVSAPF
jgi:hypothetical protein